jgi:hypothetical protein
VANLAADPIDLYVIAANQTIAKGTSRKQFDAYFKKNYPGLYVNAVGAGDIVDAKFTDLTPEDIAPPLPIVTPDN